MFPLGVNGHEIPPHPKTNDSFNHTEATKHKLHFVS